MAAIIKTYLNGNPTTLVEGASRSDLRPGDVVTCEAGVAPGGEYRWTLAFTPMDESGAVKSAATVVGDETNPQCSFTIDHEGAYLVRLIIDPGTATESTQFVRLRFLTRFGSLKLVAAGERRDGSGVVPVDATTEGWANDQNYNLQELLHHISRTAISSRTVYVDANRGNDPTNGQNTEEAEGYADFWKIQDAIDHCVAGGHCGVPASPEHPWIIVVRPGLYRESLTIHSGVILWGDPSGALNSEVIVRTEDTGAQLPGVHHVELPAAGAMAQVFGIHFVNFDGAETEGVLRVAGSADATFVLAKSWVEQKGNSATQGPCVGSLAPRLKILESKLESSALTNSDRFAVTLSSADASIVDSDVRGASGISVDASSSIQVRKSRIRAEHPDASAAGIRTWGLTSVQGTLIDVGASDGWAVDVNPTGTAGNRIGVSHSSLVSLSDSAKGGLRYNTNGVATPGAHLASVDLPPDRLVFDPPEFVDDAGVIHGTTGESLFYKADKESHTSSLSTGNLPADSVQQALDKLLDVAIAVVTLDDAYDGLLDHSIDPPTRGSGHGHQIVADATDGLGKGIPVRIVDKSSPDALSGPSNSKGRLQVVSNVEIGAIDAPEIDIDPNPFGAGPRVSFGKTVWPGGPHKAAAVVQAASDPTLGRHYHLRLQTQASELTGPGYIGSVIAQGGDSYGPADGGGVHIQAGSSTGGNPGSIFIASGEGSLVVAGSNSTGAVLTAANPCANPAGVHEDLTLSTPSGAFTVSITQGMTPAQVADAINLASASTVTAVVSGGGELQLTTTATGPFADVLLVTASAALNTALGDLTAAAVIYADGNYGDTFSMRATGANEITLGIGGTVGPMVFNADTGKLTVPGLIDPWGLIFTEVDHTLANEAGIHPVLGEGAVFVSDGTDLLIDNHPHYRGEADGGGIEQDPLAFVLSDGTGSATEVAFWSADGVISGDVNLWWDVTEGRLGVGLSAPQKKLHVETASDGDGVIFGNTSDGSKLISDYVSGNGMNLQLFDAGNTRGIMFRSYNPSWIRGWLGVGADTDPTEALHVTGNGLFTGNVTVNGDLTVQGDTTTMNTATVLVEDKNIELGFISGGVETDVSADGGGITLRGDTDKTITWDLATGAWHFNQGIDILSSAAQLRIGSSLAEYATLGVDGAAGLAIESVGAPILVTSAGNLTLDAAASLNLNTQSNDAAHAINLGTENKPGPVNIATLGTRDLNLGTTTTNTMIQGDPIVIDSAGRVTMNAAGYIAVTSSAALHLETNSHTHDINLGAENKNSPINIGTGGTRAITMSSANSEVIINGPASGSGKALTVNGDVKITGVLDPTAVVITHQAAGPELAVGESSLWVNEAGAVKFFKRVLEADATTGIPDGLALSSEITALQTTVSAMTDTLPLVTGADDGSTLLVAGGAWSVGSASGLVDGVASGDLLSWDGAAWIASSLTTDGVLGALAVLPGIAEGNILKVVDDGAGNLSWAAGADEEGSEDGHVHAQYATGAELASHTHDYIATSHVVNALVTADISNWNTAYGWGDHAGLYAVTAHSHAYIATSHVVNAITQTDITNWDASGSVSWPLSMEGHLIPDVNAAYDFGSAEYKIRHLFLSDNSLWLGDSHKVDTSTDKIRKRKRKMGLPQGLYQRIDQWIIGMATHINGGGGDGGDLQITMSGVIPDVAATVAEPFGQLSKSGVHGETPFELDYVDNAAWLAGGGSYNITIKLSRWASGEYDASFKEAWLKALIYHQVWFRPSFGDPAFPDLDPVMARFDQVQALYDAVSAMLIPYGPIPGVFNPETLDWDSDAPGAGGDHSEWSAFWSADTMFTDLDFDDEPDLISVVQPYVDYGVAHNPNHSFTFNVAKGQDYVGIETESAEVTALSGSSQGHSTGVFTVALPVTAADGAAKGRRIAISNESDPGSGDGNHMSIRLIAGRTLLAPSSPWGTVGKISGMDEWSIPMMTAMTVVCTGGEGADCKWFIVGRS
jgi:hypothetical protein